MAELKKCPGCGKLLMAGEAACTRCGVPFAAGSRPTPDREGREASPVPSGRAHAAGPRKGRGSRKKLLAGVLAALAVIVVIGAVGSGCLGDKSDMPAPVPSLPDAPGDLGMSVGDTDFPEGEEGFADSVFADPVFYPVAIKGAVLAEDHEGNPAIVVSFSWTNIGGSAASAKAVLEGEAFQAGSVLETAVIEDPGIYDGSSYTTEVQPGSSLDVDMAYVLKNMTSVVEFGLSQITGSSVDTISMDFDPDVLPQAGR